jgi:hypothetical protein
MASSMQILSPAETSREAVGVFHDVGSFNDAIDALQSAGFDRAEISLLAEENSVVEKLGHGYDKVADLEDDADVPRAVYVGREGVAQGQAAVVGGLFMLGSLAATGLVVASGGTLAAVALAAVAGGGSGGILGSVFSSLLGDHHAQHIKKQLAKGGLLLWVGIRDNEHEKRAVEILTRFSADDVHVHDIRHANEPETNPTVGLNVDPFLPGAAI